MKYGEVYNLSEAGHSELPAQLENIKKHVKALGKWDELVEGYNTAIAGATACHLTGIKGILDGYIEVSYATDGLPESARPAYEDLIKHLDQEIAIAVARNCGCQKMS